MNLAIVLYVAAVAALVSAFVWAVTPGIAAAPVPEPPGCGYLEDGHDLEQMAAIARARACLPIDRN